MTPDDGNKGPKTASNVFYLPGVDIPKDRGSVGQESVDVGYRGRRDLIKGQRGAVKAYLRLPGTSLQNIVEDLENFEIRIKTSKGEVPILKFLEDRWKKPELKSV